MQVAVIPLLNDRELLTPVYVGNYLVDPGHNKYSDMIGMVRELGDSFYGPEQVENGSADGAYAKSETTQQYYVDSIDLQKNGWVDLR